MTRPPRVFVSYSHDSPEHSNRVLGFADRMREHGIDAVIDQYDPHPAEGWPKWMEDRFQEADFTLLIITEGYLRRFDGQEGLGVAWEANLLRNRLYGGVFDNRNVIPVLFDSANGKFIPPPLQGVTRYTLTTLELDGSGYEQLYRRLTNQPLTTKPELGGVRSLPAKERRYATPKTEPITTTPLAAPQLNKTGTAPTDVVQITIVIDREFEEFNRFERELFAAAISSLAGIKGGVRIVDVQHWASIKITLEGSPEDMVVVFAAVGAGRLNSSRVVSAELNGQEILAPIDEYITSAIDPHLEVQLPERNVTTVNHVVLLVHGIRDEGEWQQVAEELINKIDGMEAVRVNFGFYDAISFVSLLGNSANPYQTLVQTYKDARSRYKDAKISVIAHSFGTDLVGRLIRENPQTQLHRIILCGSVLKRNFEWKDFRDRFGIGVRENETAVLNECGDMDIWPVVAKSASPSRYGDVGRYGFQNNLFAKSRWFNGGHSLFFARGHMQENWLPFLTQGLLPKDEARQPAPLFYERLAATFAVGWIWFALVALVMLVRQFWWLLLLLIGYAIWRWAWPYVVPPNPEVDSKITVRLDGKEPASIGPAHLRGVFKKGLVSQAKFSAWDKNWERGEGPKPSELVHFPCPGTFKLNCSLDKVDMDYVIQRPTVLSFSETPILEIPNTVYESTFEITKGIENCVIDLNSKKHRVFPKEHR